jgi:hypothetical protein
MFFSAMRTLFLLLSSPMNARVAFAELICMVLVMQLPV